MTISDRHQPPLDTLRVSDKQWHELLTDLHQTSTSYKGHERRKIPRHMVKQLTKLVMRIHQPGGGISYYLVRPRNISDQSIAFLHGNFIHSNTHCHIILKADDGETVMMVGTVVRCHLIKGKIHDIGVQFNQTFDIDSVQTSDLDI